MDIIVIAAIIGALLLTISGLLVLHLRERSQHRQLKERFEPVISVDDEWRRISREIDSQQQTLEGLKNAYSEKKYIYDSLLRQVAVFDEKLAFAEMGVYEPHFDFTDSEDYKAAIVQVRERQKFMVSNKSAVISKTAWTVDGSASKGQTMTNRNIKLTLRAFNNECDAAIANARWNNVNAMEKRILNARTQIDNLNASNSVVISQEYVQRKLDELYLTHEQREKVKAERDERAEAARLAREEQKLLRDMERAEEDEAHFQRLLNRARSEAQKSVGPQLEAYNEKIKILERDLAEAHARAVRAQSLAEKTRSGYVYIISNIGSFGEDVVKIGLTRRLDPIDRVQELGDASVPFSFDVHAIIYSEDAPSLERALHGEFDKLRVNAQNYRKEFFWARIDDVEAAVKRLAPSAPFFKDIEAQEYRETLAKRHMALTALDSANAEAFPATI